MRIVFSALVGVLVVFYGFVTYLALHPRVSREYKAYFIDRTSSDWRPTRYAATPDQPISLALPGLPTSVQYLYGFSSREPWGRWTDARHGSSAGLVLTKALTGPVCVTLKAMPAGSQSGKAITVQFGDQQQKVVFTSGTFSEYSLDFFETAPADNLEFRFNSPLPAQNSLDRHTSDPRKLGLALANIRFASQTCNALHQ